MGFGVFVRKALKPLTLDMELKNILFQYIRFVSQTLSFYG